MLRISKSQIQTYLICPRKFWFQYVVGAMPEFMPASLPFGRALHAAVALFLSVVKGKRDEAAVGIYRRRVHGRV
jgi:CRISPR/Cas system-associated exonuclease Cas4 (RecB family)